MLVYYHSPCLDGLTAAWAVSRKYPDAALMPLSHGQGLLEDLRGKDILFVDIIPCREDLERCIRDAGSVTILDHHASAFRDIEAWVSDGMSTDFEFIFDPNKSGAGLAWDCFHGSEDRPWIVDYVQDQDLGIHNLSQCRDIISYISHTLNASPFVETVSMIEEMGLDHALAEGTEIRKHREVLLEECVESARLYRLPGLPDPVPGLECPRTLVSEVLTRLSRGHVLAFAWREAPGGGFAYSFRNQPNGIDLSSWVPETFGTGGGHPHASGLTTPKLIHEDV